MSYRSVVIGLGLLCAGTMPWGVFAVNVAVKSLGPATFWFWFVVVGLAVAALMIECAMHFDCRMMEEQLRNRSEGGSPATTYVSQAQQAYLFVYMQAATIMLYGSVMDGGVWWAAARWLYLVYAVPALLLVAARWKRWTYAERLYLRWGWLPLLAFGVPLSVPHLQAAGLIRTLGS